jgi:hypothetical protein
VFTVTWDAHRGTRLSGKTIATILSWQEWKTTTTGQYESNKISQELNKNNTKVRRGKLNKKISQSNTAVENLYRAARKSCLNKLGQKGQFNPLQTTPASITTKNCKLDRSTYRSQRHTFETHAHKQNLQPKGQSLTTLGAWRQAPEELPDRTSIRVVDGGRRNRKREGGRGNVKDGVTAVFCRYFTLILCICHSLHDGLPWDKFAANGNIEKRIFCVKSEPNAHCKISILCTYILWTWVGHLSKL